MGKTASGQTLNHDDYACKNIRYSITQRSATPKLRPLQHQPVGAFAVTSPTANSR